MGGELQMRCPTDALLVAIREGDSTQVRVEREGQQSPLPVDRSLSRRVHLSTVTGVDWGNLTPSSFHLGICILAYVAGPDIAIEHYAEFSRDVLASMPHDGWRLPTSAVLNWLTIAVGSTPPPGNLIAGGD